MSVFDDPRDGLQWLEEELLDEELQALLGEEEEDCEEDCEEEYSEEYEEEYEEAPVRPRYTMPEPQSMADRHAIYVEKKRSPGKNRGLKFLAFCELLAIAGLVWWWIKWLY